jgi:hypothetical protein
MFALTVASSRSATISSFSVQVVPQSSGAFWFPFRYSLCAQRIAQGVNTNVKSEALAHARRARANDGKLDGGPRREADTVRDRGAVRETGRDAKSLCDGAPPGEGVPPPWERRRVNAMGAAVKVSRIVAPSFARAE